MIILLLAGIVTGSAVIVASIFALAFWGIARVQNRNTKARKRNTRILTGDALWRELAAKRAAAK